MKRSPDCNWTGRRLRNAVMLVGFAGVQIAVPLVQLRADRPARYGWQMYSGIKVIPRFEVITIGGDVRRVVLTDYVAHVRADLRYDTALPAHLCRIMPDASAVRVHDRMAGRDAVTACPR